MMHLVIFNHHQISLPGVEDLLVALRSHPQFKVHVWHDSLATKINREKYKSISLMGNFTKHDHNSNPLGIIDKGLFEFWKSKRDLKRIWICSHIDLHLGLKKMILGKKCESSLSEKDCEALISENFDALAWSYEHNNFQSKTIPLTFGSREIDQKLKQAERFLRSTFSCRLDFPWAINFEKYVRSVKYSDFRYQICVPGANYTSRIRALKTLGEQFTCAPFARNDRLIRTFFFYIAKVGLNSHFLQGGLKTRLRKWNLYWCISKSNYTYVDGGELEYFVRKYLEAPAFGSLLVCPDSEVISQYGFVKNKHYLEFQDFVSSEDFSLNEFSSVDLRKNLSSLISTLHSYEARVAQFLEFANRTSKNIACIGIFKHGVFEFIEV